MLIKILFEKLFQSSDEMKMFYHKITSLSIDRRICYTNLNKIVSKNKLLNHRRF